MIDCIHTDTQSQNPNSQTVIPETPVGSQDDTSTDIINSLDRIGRKPQIFFLKMVKLFLDAYEFWS